MDSLKASLFIMLPTKAILGMDSLITANSLTEGILWPVIPHNA